jgi:hypothetical protein
MTLSELEKKSEDISSKITPHKPTREANRADLRQVEKLKHLKKYMNKSNVMYVIFAVKNLDNTSFLYRHNCCSRDVGWTNFFLDKNLSDFKLKGTENLLAIQTVNHFTRVIF